MSMRRTQDRALHHRRTRYKPGMGFCRCRVCNSAWRAAQEAYRDDPTRPLPDEDSPVAGCEYVNLEKVFADEWERRCRLSHGVNHGHGLVQDLMVVYRPRGEHGVEPPGRMAFWLTPRERVIVATVIQWLGTNVGFSFLWEVLRRGGYLVTEDRPRVLSRKVTPRPEELPALPPVALARFLDLDTEEG